MHSMVSHFECIGIQDVPLHKGSRVDSIGCPSRVGGGMYVAGPLWDWDWVVAEVPCPMMVKAVEPSGLLVHL